VGFPALASPAAEAVFVLDLDTLFRRLPALTKAQVAWTKPRIDVGLKRLLSEPIDDTLLDDVVRELSEPVRALSRAVIELLISNREEFRTLGMDDLRREQDRLQAFLPDGDSRDTLAWVLGFLRSFFGLCLAIQPDQLATLDAEQIVQDSNNRELGLFMRAQVALMAAVEAARVGAQPDRCVRLIDSAFLNFMAFRTAIRSHGLWVSPFPNETSDERRESLLRYAARLRETLTDQDWQAQDAARVGDLR